MHDQEVRQRITSGTQVGMPKRAHAGQQQPWQPHQRFSKSQKSASLAKFMPQTRRIAFTTTGSKEASSRIPERTTTRGSAGESLQHVSDNFYLWSGLIDPISYPRSLISFPLERR